MKLLGMILLGIVAFVVAVVVLVLAIRFVNGLRYASTRRPGRALHHLRAR